MRTVVLAALAAPLPYEVREAVRDWTAGGLLTETMWVDAAGIDAGTSDVEVLGVAPGTPTRIGRLQAVLAGSETRQVRLVSLQVVGDADAQVPVATIQRVQEIMAASGVQVLRLNLLLRTDAGRGAKPAPLMLSTPNVVVQPADGLTSSSPGASVDSGTPTFVAHCTGALATVAGLWAGQADAPYDRDPAWVGEQAEMVRWYRRAVDGADVWHGLRTSLVPADRLPVAVDSGGQPLEVAPDAAVPGIVASANGSLLQATQALTGEAQLQPFTPPPRRKIGFGEAISEFLAFVVSSVRNAPARWLRTAQHELSTAIAERATNALYGSGGDVEVVVNGTVPRRRDGGGEDISTLTQAVAGVATGLTNQLAVPPPTRDFADAFCHTATSLLDGGERGDLPITLPRRGVAALVVPHPAAVAPDPAEPPFTVGADLGLPDDAVVTSWSPYSAIRVEAQLRSAEEQEVRSGGRNAALLAGIQDARAGLDGWVGRQSSLTWNLLLTLAQRLDGARVQLNRVIDEARQAGQVDGPSQELRRREEVERGVLRLTVFLLLPIVAAIVLCFVFAPVKVALIVLAVLALGWLALLVSRYLALQSIAWQMIHQRDTAKARREWADAQVLQATYDVFRLSVAYGCASAWSRVIATVVHRPFGAADHAAAVTAPEPVDTPLEMTSATGEFDRLAMAEVISQVRRQVLGAGWLGDELRRRITDIAELRRREAGWDRPQSIIDDPGLDPARELQAAAVLVAAPPVEAGAATAFDGRVRSSVERFEHSRGGRWALQTIRLRDTGVVATGATAADFLDPIVGAGASRLPEIGFSDAGTMDRAATIASSPTSTTVGSQGSSLRTGAGVAPGGTPFDRTVVRLDRGQRTHPSSLGVGSAAPVPPPPGGAGWGGGGPGVPAAPAVPRPPDPDY